MTTLLLIPGLPGAGKTTRALAWVAQDPTRRVRINRDSLRVALFNDPQYYQAPWEVFRAREAVVTGAATGAAEDALGMGWSVVVDDTNLTWGRNLGTWVAVAAYTDARMEFDLTCLTTTPMEVRIARQANRPTREQVPEQFIRQAWQDHRDWLATGGDDFTEARLIRMLQAGVGGVL